MSASTLSAGSTAAFTAYADERTLSARELREHLRRSRQRVATLVDRIDVAIDERRRHREEVRHLRAENQRLVRLARTYEEQAGMTPDNAIQKEG